MSNEDTTSYESGLVNRRRVLGDAWVDRALANRNEFNSECATVMNEMGLLLKKQARYEEALAYYKRSFGIESVVFGPEHPKIGTLGSNNMRSMPLRVFPYTPHYRVEGDIIRIFAFAHQKRRAGYWRKRRLP